jgi:hypothetical protein
VRVVIVAIDYDSTWTADPGLWETFAGMMRDRGHTLVLVTNRMDTALNRNEVIPKVGPHVKWVMFAGPTPKRDFAVSQGVHPQIWIDDNPQTVVLGLKGIWSK